MQKKHEQAPRALFDRYLQKEKRWVCGILSGTSADGIDVGLFRISGMGAGTKVKTHKFRTYAFSTEVRRKILQLQHAKQISLRDMTVTNTALGKLFGQSIHRFCRDMRRSTASIDLICSHGQTMYHHPAAARLFGQTVRGTLQIGDPDMIAKETGILTIGDFRCGDVAAGGTGAPLTPYVDQLLFKSSSLNRIVINLGGIGNVTVLLKRRTNVIGFDWGPANMVIDGVMQKLFRRPYDKNGETALKGNVRQTFLTYLMKHPYFKRRPPKSTGREDFGEAYVQRILQAAEQQKLKAEDIVTTVTCLTAAAFADAVKKNVREPLDEIIVSGGGIHNKALMIMFEEYCSGADIRSSEDFGIDPDAKEALVFAVLGNELMYGRSANLPSVTGAAKPAHLGKICLP